MPLTLNLPGGWFDLPDSAFAAGANVIEDLVVALNSLVRFACVADEYILAGGFRNGETVPTPQSADDGYAYSRSELLYAFSLVFTPDSETGINGGPGNLLYLYDYVEQDTGLVQSRINYYNLGSNETATTNGVTDVLTCCRRGAGAHAALPAVTGGGYAGGGGGVSYDGQGNQGDPIINGRVVYLG